MHVENRYFFYFSKYLRSYNQVLLSTIFYKILGSFNETLTGSSLACNIFSRKSWFLVLDKSQAQIGGDVITWFFSTVRKQKFRCIQAHSWNPPHHPHHSFQCFLSVSVWCVYFVYLHHSYQYYFRFTGRTKSYCI